MRASTFCALVSVTCHLACAGAAPLVAPSLASPRSADPVTLPDPVWRAGYDASFDLDRYVSSESLEPVTRIEFATCNITVLPYEDPFDSLRIVGTARSEDRSLVDFIRQPAAEVDPLEVLRDGAWIDKSH